MKKVACLIISVCVAGMGSLYAQGEMDAYKLSQTDINGSARALSMGGAFGALGGDISSMHTNPAGLGIYRSSEIVGTLNLNMYHSSSDWSGSQSSANKTTFNLGNFGYVGYFPTGNDEGIVSWNVGFGYNRLKNFNRTYRVSGQQEYSMADYVGKIASTYDGGIPESELIYREGSYDPYFNSQLPWMPILGYEGGYLKTLDSKGEYASIFGNFNSNGTWVIDAPNTVDWLVKEWGGIDQYNFSFATNISNIVFLGATFGVTDINYRMSSNYDETFFGREYLYLDNHFSTDGTGYNFNIGAIVRPTDYLRIGVAYNSPTWYKMTDYFHASAGTLIEVVDQETGAVSNSEVNNSTPNNQAYDYRFRTPDKWIFSLAGILGQNALISFDYELSNYKSSKFTDRDGYEPNYLMDTNDYIREDFQMVNTFRLGAEYKVTPQFAVRAGGYYQTSSAKTHLQDNQVEVPVAGTIPHFTVDKGTYSVSVGFGYRFTPNVYMDMAYVFRQHKENAYAFSNIYDNVDPVVSVPADLKTNLNRLALTLGYKF
ncbi:MAG: outer membrane protein transport protein [Tannerellaceae bacterium]|nr:outer membrane protein transport protein [Tannerellaceae bacterium]